MDKRLGYLLTLAMGCMALAGTWLHFQEPPDEAAEDHEESDSLVAMNEEEAKNYGIAVKKAGPAKLEIETIVRGKVVLHPDRIAHILPKVAGVAVEARKNRGDPVEIGEVIAILESREAAEAKALYLAALEKEKLAKTVNEREGILYQKKVSSEQDYLNSNANWQAAHIELQLTKQKLYALGFDENDIPAQDDADLRFLVIRSPMNGVILERDLTSGEYVDEKQAIYTIADLNKVWVELGVYPSDILNIHEGQSAEVKLADSSQTTEGTILYLSPIIDEETIASKAVIELDNAEKKWRPGSFVTANIRQDPVAIPMAVSKKAVQMLEGEAIVFLQKEGGFEKTAVRIGRSDDKNIEILAGLAPGDKYVSAGSFLLKADLGKDSVEHED